MLVSPSSRSSLDSTSRSVFPPLSPVLGPLPGPRLPPRPAHAAARPSCLLPPTARRGSARPPSFFLPEPAAEPRWWKTPMGVVGLAFASNCSPPLLNPRRGASIRKSPPCPRPAAASGQVVAAAMLAPPRILGEKGQRGHSPFSRGRPWVRVHTPALACAPTGRLGRAPTPRGLTRLDRRRGRLARLSGWIGHGGEKKGNRKKLAGGVLTAAREEGERVWCWVVGRKALWVGPQRHRVLLKSAHRPKLLSSIYLGFIWSRLRNLV
jgi:hypothetical protein